MWEQIIILDVSGKLQRFAMLHSTSTRLNGQTLSERIGQHSFLRIGRGVSSNLATEAMVRAIPDGYTLLARAKGGPSTLGGLATLFD